MNKVNWHAGIIVAALVIVPVVGSIMKLDPNLIGVLTVGVVSLATASGFLHAQDAQGVQDLAAKLTIQTNSAITAVKDDLTVMHAVSTANVAAVAQTVAVHAALISPAAPAPPPITLIPVPTVVPAPESIKASPHLVD